MCKGNKSIKQIKYLTNDRPAKTLWPTIIKVARKYSLNLKMFNKIPRKSS